MRGTEQMVGMWYNTGVNHIKSDGLFQQHRHPFSTCDRGARTMPDHTLTFPKRKHEVICGVYMFTCLANGKRYIGSSYDIYKRLQEHLGHLARNDHENHYLQEAWNFYGEDAFDVVILEECLLDARNARERVLILEYSPEWNLKLPNLERDAWAASEETRAKISAAGRGRPKSEEHRARIGESQVGKKLSQATRDRIAAAHTGKKLSEEHKQKVSEAGRGRAKSPEMRAKNSLALKAYWERRRNLAQGRLF